MYIKKIYGDEIKQIFIIIKSFNFRDIQFICLAMNSTEQFNYKYK